MEEKHKPSLKLEIVYEENGVLKYISYYELIDWNKMNGKAIDTCFQVQANALKKVILK